MLQELNGQFNDFIFFEDSFYDTSLCSFDTVIGLFVTRSVLVVGGLWVKD
jgi:hypothetical protein